MGVPGIKFPQSPFVDFKTGRITREWQQWLLNPQFITINLEGVIGITSGGTGIGTIPGVDQILIGNGTGYDLATLQGTANQISLTHGPSTLTFGISATYAGQASIVTVGTLINGFWNATPITADFGGTGLTSYVIGDILYASATNALSRLPDVATGNALISGGAGVAPAWGKIGLTTHVSGTLPATSGGTGLNSYAIGDLLYASTTTALSSLADIAAGNALISGGVNTAPSWGKINLTTHITSNLPVTNLNSGTGASSTTYWRGDATWADPLANVVSGTYTPTLTNIANLDASTAYSCQYMRVGSVVTVSGRIDVDPTLAATSTQLGISLPIASNLTNFNECCGAANCSTVAGQSAAILGDAAGDRAAMVWVASDITNQPMYFTFTYRII